MEDLRLRVMVLLVPLVLFLGGGGYHQKEKLSHSEFERPYIYELEQGRSVKRPMRYPDINWHSHEGFFCIDQNDYIELVQFIVQLNGVLDQYEAAREEGE